MTGINRYNTRFVCVINCSFLEYLAYAIFVCLLEVDIIKNEKNTNQQALGRDSNCCPARRWRINACVELVKSLFLSQVESVFIRECLMKDHKAISLTGVLYDERFDSN